ncbi:MAG: SBBP repeat-containing protein [candidate division WOR-3 bacterium]
MDCDCITVKYDADGNELWAARYNAAYYYDDGCGIATDNFGNVYVGGRTFVSWTNCNYSTMKYNPNGRREWLKGYEGPGNSTDVLTAIAVDNQGNVYVTGYSYGSGTSYDYATIKYIQEPSISEEKENKVEKKLAKKGDKIYDLTGKLVKEDKLKRGVYFIKTEKGKEKILILK